MDPNLLRILVAVIVLFLLLAGGTHIGIALGISGLIGEIEWNYEYR